jgi:hypothetical protein
LLQSVESNQRRGHNNARFFEIGLCFSGVKADEQASKLAGVISANRFDAQWSGDLMPDNPAQSDERITDNSAEIGLDNAILLCKTASIPEITLFCELNEIYTHNSTQVIQVCCN